MEDEEEHVLSVDRNGPSATHALVLGTRFRRRRRCHARGATRPSEELEAAAAHPHGAATVARLFVDVAADLADLRVKYATADFAELETGGERRGQGQSSRYECARGTGDLKKLLDLYVSADDAKKPSVAPLNHPDVLYNLIAEASRGRWILKLPDPAMNVSN